MKTLLVPLALDVLMVRQIGSAEDWALTALNIPAKDYKGKPKKHKLLPDPFQSLSQARPAGAYLQWALPDALARSGVENKSRPEFSPLPNRWLIMRLSGAVTSGNRNVAAWLLPDSGAESPICIPVAPDMPGLDTPTFSLTALGYGDPAWSGFYDNVVNRFALYDALPGVTGPIAYVVCGWYTDPGKDPICNSSETDFYTKMKAFQWQLNTPLLSGTPCPSQSVYHGMAVSIGWPDPHWINDKSGILGTEPDLRPASEAIEVVLGETLTEAIAALITPEGASPELNNILEGTLKGIIGDPTNPDGPATLDTALHVSRFGSKPSGKQLFSIDMQCRSDLNKNKLPVSVRQGFADHDIVLPSDNLVEVIVESKDSQWWITVRDSDQNIVDSYSVIKEKSKISIFTSAHTEHIWQPAPASMEQDVFAGSLTTVRRTLPRVWHPLDPSVIIHGGGRSPKHGGDGRYTETGDLVCRMNGETLTAFGVEAGNSGKGISVLPPSPLSSLPKDYGVPLAAMDLLVELSCLDPGSAPDLSQATSLNPSPVAKIRAQWWKTFGNDLSVPAGAYLEGLLPSPVAVTPPMRPWTPLHLEWAAAYLPSPRGAHDWSLASVDFELPEALTRPDPDPAHQLSGRVLLNSTPSFLINEVTSQGDGLNTHSDADLLGGSLTGISEQLRGDWLGAILRKSDDSAALKDDPRPADFLALRAGFLRIDRLRLVDGFGQYVDLLGGLSLNPAKLIFGNSLTVRNQPDLAALRPRFTAPARALLRFVDGKGGQVEAGSGVSPVCGYVVPSLLDGTLEFFDADGNGLGQLRPDPTMGTVWEEDPGRPATLGARPHAAMPKDSFLGDLAEGIVDADTALAQSQMKGDNEAITSSLRSLLAILDITRWTVDLSGRAGDEHLSLLLGHPIAVVRAILEIDVQDPRTPPENETTAVPVKLGTLLHSQDGLLAYYVSDNFDRVYVVDPSVADLMPATGSGTIDSPYIDKSGVFYANSGRIVPLTLLMMPCTDVHVTTGLLPQKKAGLLKEWTAAALSRISPALRRGPILRDPSATRLPIPADIRANWLWHRRSDPSNWVSDQIVAATSEAIMPNEPIQASDGWLQAKMIPDAAYSTTPIQLQISFIRSKKARGGKQVLAIGGKNPDGTLYLLSVAQAVQMQESGRYVYYVEIDPQILKNDLKQLAVLVEKLKQPSDDISSYIESRLSMATQQALSQYHGAKSDLGKLQDLLAKDLNDIIVGDCIFNKAIFSVINLRPETKQLLSENPQGTELEHLNRRLLEDAYPNELRRMRVYTQVVKLGSGTKYLRTIQDRKSPNNLLNLPEFNVQANDNKYKKVLDAMH